MVFHENYSNLFLCFNLYQLILKIYFHEEEIVIVGNCDLGLSSLLFLTSLPSLVRIGDVMDWKLDNDTKCRLNQIHGGWDVANGHLKREY